MLFVVSQEMFFVNANILRINKHMRSKNDYALQENLNDRNRIHCIASDSFLSSKWILFGVAPKNPK